MTVSEIQLEIIARMGKGASVTASQLIPAIDEGNKRIYNKILVVHERAFYKSDTFDAVSGKEEYTTSDGIPTDIKRILKLETRYADQTERVRATKIKLFNVDQMDHNTTTYRSKDRPGFDWFGNGSTTTILFSPKHDADGTDYNKIWYLAQPTKLTTGSQTPIVPVDAHYLIVEFGLAVAQLMEDEDKAGYTAFLSQWEHDVNVWLESEYPGTSEPQFAQDAGGDELL